MRIVLFWIFVLYFKIIYFIQEITKLLINNMNKQLKPTTKINKKYKFLLRGI